jgi:hypothetical protein
MDKRVHGVKVVSRVDQGRIFFNHLAASKHGYAHLANGGKIGIRGFDVESNKVH